MPFDGSGNFSRAHDWTDDASNGIKILASRMDEEFDNFAAGMNVIFFRNGLVPMAGNLAMGQNYVTGLGAGSNAAPGLRFVDDPISGLYLDGLYKPSLASQGVKRFGVNTAGAEVIGALSVSGAITTGALSTFSATGEVLRVKSPDEAPFIAGYNNASTTRFGYLMFQNSSTEIVSNTGSVKLSTTGGGLTVAQAGGAGTFSGALSVSGTLNISGLTRFANSAGDEKARLVGNAGAASPYLSGYNAAETVRFGYLQFMSGSTIVVSDAGSVQLAPGGIVKASLATDGTLSITGNINSTGSTSTGDTNFSQYLNAGDPIRQWDANDYDYYLRATNTRGFAVSGSVIATVTAAGVAVTGTLSASGAITQGGNQVWHAGNLTPGSYAPLAGAAFTGGVSFGDANQTLSLSGGNAKYQFDTNDYLLYDRTANKLYVYIGGAAVVSVDSSGNIRAKGDVLGFQVSV